MVSFLFPLFIAAVVFLAVIAAVIVIVITITKSKSQNHLGEFNTYKAMANNLTLSNQEIREELSELKEKIGSIERMLKEVE
jgi:predicted PurR-regulated permease PerM